MLRQSASSESLGFRPPQFSDNVAWIPEWLQPHVAAIGLDDEEEEKKLRELGERSFKDTRKQFLPKPNSINPEDYEIRDAVELSSAASEALVIYEQIKSELSSDALSTTAILEFALRVKQNRLQWLDDVLTFSNENDRSNSDVLSDLDNSDMEDAYRDVGLSVISSANICTKSTSVSQVEETPISKQNIGEDRTVGSKHECQEGNLYDSGAEKQLEMLKIDLAVDIADVEKENLLRSNDNLDLVPSIERGDDLMMHQLPRRKSQDTNSQDSQQEDTVRGAKRRRINRREILLQTSYLSESADVAPDLNSCVHKHDGNLKFSLSSTTIEGPRRTETNWPSLSQDIAKDYVPPDLNSCVLKYDGSLKISQSSINMEGLCRTETNWSSLSQAIAKDSILSFVDPLCSVIPCCISTRTHIRVPAHNHDHGKHIGYTMLMPEVGLVAGNVPTSFEKHEIVYREKQDKTAPNSLDSDLNKRHTSFESASLPPCNLENVANHIQAQQVESIMYARSISHTQKISSVNSLQSGCPCEATNGAELHVCLQNVDTTPPMICHGARHRVQAHNHSISTENENQDLVQDSLAKFDPSGILQTPCIQNGKFPDTSVPTGKRVRFTVVDVEYQKKRDSSKLISKYRSRRSSRLRTRKQPSEYCWSSQEVKEHLTDFDMKDKKKPIFQGLDFLLTGLPCKKEKEVERILRRYGGAVLADIPSPFKKGGSDSVQLPVVICTKKLQTRKFLYGCAVNAFLLQVDWVTDSIEAGSVLPPKKYMILPNQQNRWANRIQKSIRRRTVDCIFCKVGIMVHGQHGVSFELTEVIKHGQGRVYKTLQGLVRSLKNKTILTGIIIADKESYAARHLRKCASEQRIPMMSTSWIINSIYNGKLLPFENNAPSQSASIEIQAVSSSQEWTQEI